MTDALHVRNLVSGVIAKLKRRAARHDRSTEAGHDDLAAKLKRRAARHGGSFDALAAQLRKLTKRRKQTPSEVLVRQARDER